MDKFEAVAWFASGAGRGGLIAFQALHRWALREMRKSLKVYHEALDTLGEAEAVMAEEKAA